MFESITITSRLEPRVSISVGDLAQSLLYYGSVNLVGSGEIVAALAGTIGTLQTLELIERGHLRIQLERQMVATQSRTGSDGETVHDIVKIGRVDWDANQLIQRALERAGWERYQAKIAAARFAKRVQFFDYPNYDGKLSRQTLLENEIAKSVIPVYFEQFGAHDAIRGELLFEVSQDASGLRVATNIDFDHATAAYRGRYGLVKEQVTPALLLDALRQLYDQQYISAELRSDVLATPLIMSANSARLGQVVGRAIESDREIRVFEEFVFEGAGSLQQVMTSGKRSFDEFLKLLDQGRRFRQWITDQPPDAKLLAEYHRRISEKTILEKLPGKTVRFALFTGGGMLADAVIGGPIGATLGVGLSAADTFLIEKLGLGWKPHHFVTGEFREFVKGQQA